MDSGGQTIVGVVAEGNDLIGILELGQGDDGAEDLLLHDLHVLADIGEDGGLDEVALVAVALATSNDGSTLVLAGLDVAHDAVELQLRNLGALEGLLVEGVANLVLLGAGLESSHELVVDALLDVHTRTGAAALAVVVVDTKVDPVDGLLNVGVVEDNVGGLAAQLQGNLLQVGASSGLHDGAADSGGASEGDLVDAHVRGDGGTSDLAEASDNVQDTSGEAGLLDEGSKSQGRQRGLLSGLEDNGVAGGQGGANLPGKHQQGEVPWDDLAADTNSLGAGVVEHVGGDVDGLALDLVGPATVVAQAGNNGTDVAAGHGNGLAVVERLNGSQLLRVLFGQVGQLQQQVTALLGGDLLPGALKGSAGSIDGKIDILLGGLVDGGNDLLGGGVDDLEGLALDTADELVVNVPVNCCVRKRTQPPLIKKQGYIDGARNRKLKPKTQKPKSKTQKPLTSQCPG